jgi:hypothetical protein
VLCAGSNANAHLHRPPATQSSGAPAGPETTCEIAIRIAAEIGTELAE